jgi:hypothetical protein
MHRLFILSPAFMGGKKAAQLLNSNARFDLAIRVRNQGAPLGEIFSFLSGLYFRGKWSYSKTFANPPAGLPKAFVITPNQGLCDAEKVLTLKNLKGFTQVPIELEDERYLKPLERDARSILEMHPECRFVLLGSIATAKYIDPLLNIWAERLLFPSDFVGRGDMSRGGLMLRSAAKGEELRYIPVMGARRRGARPPKLERLKPDRRNEKVPGIKVPVSSHGGSIR